MSLPAQKSSTQASSSSTPAAAEPAPPSTLEVDILILANNKRHNKDGPMGPGPLVYTHQQSETPYMIAQCEKHHLKLSGVLHTPPPVRVDSTLRVQWHTSGLKAKFLAGSLHKQSTSSPQAVHIPCQALWSPRGL
ncbi:hypothetical protein DFP72DRAFT_1061658 [Ephemerocybe angulata]|uniref:Uncharacterized protein n=1 Tax=Ephemerocybe angulata TaxID=980116 RepID=A0A8H6I9J8_9AGAR|nr:hypothetical protein DFP72DRAFT_1061658 [Tulosesus angulatus]